MVRARELSFACSGLPRARSFCMHVICRELLQCVQDVHALLARLNTDLRDACAPEGGAQAQVSTQLQHVLAAAHLLAKRDAPFASAESAQSCTSLPLSPCFRTFPARRGSQRTAAECPAALSAESSAATQMDGAAAGMMVEGRRSSGAHLPVAAAAVDDGCHPCSTRGDEARQDVARQDVARMERSSLFAAPKRCPVLQYQASQTPQQVAERLGSCSQAIPEGTLDCKGKRTACRSMRPGANPSAGECSSRLTRPCLEQRQCSRSMLWRAMAVADGRLPLQ
jgi:hypothetical protein